MTRSYIHFDAQSTKKASAFVFRRNSAELTPSGPVLSATSALPAESFFDREGATWANRYRNPTYDQRRQLVGEIIRKEVLKLDRAPGTIRLLDFGCGGGVLLKDATNLGLHVTGVDNSIGMIRAARDELAGLSEQVNLEWLRSRDGEGDYERESYDIVLCLSVLEFVADIQSLLSRVCARVAKRGIFVVSVPNRHSRLRCLEGFVHRHPRAFRYLSRLDHLTGADSYLNYQAYQFTRAELSAILRGCGLSEEDHQFHIAPSFLRALERFEQVGMMFMAVFRRA
ncbi:MAG: hypothetical protein DMG60_00150 [Acidobacteria bacterium]|nr:MAG: hypothetical protein DMG60_00150 [Acidobacteriota bacterium]